MREGAVRTTIKGDKAFTVNEELYDLETDPGERVCLPTFGAGLRRLLFAPMNA